MKYWIFLLLLDTTTVDNTGTKTPNTALAIE